MTEQLILSLMATVICALAITSILFYLKNKESNFVIKVLNEDIVEYKKRINHICDVEHQNRLLQKAASESTYGGAEIAGKMLSKGVL